MRESVASVRRPLGCELAAQSSGRHDHGREYMRKSVGMQVGACTSMPGRWETGRIEYGDGHRAPGRVEFPVGSREAVYLDEIQCMAQVVDAGQGAGVLGVEANDGQYLQKRRGPEGK